MAEERKSDQKPGDDYMKGGKGRKDEVGGSGIYPASSPNAPAGAEVRTEGDLVGHKGPRRKSSTEQGVKSDQSSGSE